MLLLLPDPLSLFLLRLLNASTSLPLDNYLTCLLTMVLELHSCIQRALSVVCPLRTPSLSLSQKGKSCDFPLYAWKLLCLKISQHFFHVVHGFFLSSFLPFLPPPFPPSLPPSFWMNSFPSSQRKTLRSVESRNACRHIFIHTCTCVSITDDSKQTHTHAHRDTQFQNRCFLSNKAMTITSFMFHICFLLKMEVKGEG